MFKTLLLALIVPAMLLFGAAPASAKPHRSAVASAHAGPAKAKHRVAHHKKAKPHHHRTRHHR